MHVTMLLLLLASPTDAVSEGADVVPARSRAEWMEDVTEALREQAQGQDIDQPQAVMQLISLYQQVAQDTELGTTDRNRLMAKLHSRMMRVSPKLSRDVEIRQARIELISHHAEQEQQLERLERIREDQLVLGRWHQALGQVIGPGAAGGAGAGAGGGLPDHGEELVELIQTVISPEAWEVHGGPMSIFYFKSRRVLVVSATSEVHEKIGGLGADLRRAGN